MNEIEKYAIKTGRIHPAIAIKVYHLVSVPSFRAHVGMHKPWSPDHVKLRITSGFWGRFSGRGQATAIYVRGDTIYAMRGALNNPKPVRGNNWDLATIPGFALFAHEIFHVWQNENRIPAHYWRGVWLSLTRSRKFYDHQYFPREVAAMEFQKRVVMTLAKDPSVLKVFEGLR